MEIDAMSEGKLTSRVSVVTGGAGGIGQAVCRELARAGSSVVALDTDAAAAREAALRLSQEFGVAARGYHVDVRRRDTVDSAVSAVLRDFGTIDHLVNAHGIQHLSPFGSFPEEKWIDVHDINLQGVFRTTQAVWPHMIARNFGRVIHIASVHGLVASKLKSAYVAAKHGVVGMTKAAAIEGGPHGVTVNAVCPGAVLTDLVVRQGPEYVRQFGGGISEREALERAFLGVMPTGRFVEPVEVGQLCAFLCSDAARSITGAAIPIDGGWSAH